MNKIIMSALVAGLFLGCSSGSSSSSSNITGQFIDSPVKGLKFECSSGLSGLTNANGEFTCKVNDTVVFFINNYRLGEALAQEIITPYSLFPLEEEYAYNLAQLLQTLDNDGNPTDFIELNEEIREHFEDCDILLNKDNFTQNISSCIGTSLVNRTQAETHLDTTLENYTSTNPIEMDNNSVGVSYALLQGYTSSICTAVRNQTVDPTGATSDIYWVSGTENCSDTPYSEGSFCRAEDQSYIGGSGTCVVKVTVESQVSDSQPDTSTATPTVTDDINEVALNNLGNKVLRYNDGVTTFCTNNTIKYEGTIDGTFAQLSGTWSVSGNNLNVTYTKYVANGMTASMSTPTTEYINNATMRVGDNLNGSTLQSIEVVSNPSCSI